VYENKERRNYYYGQVFTMLNILPQSPDNNRGPWEKAERFERELAQAGREVYVIAGGVGSQASFHGITAPDSTWKIIVALKRGKSFPDGQEKAQSSPWACRIRKASKMTAGSSIRPLWLKSSRRPVIASSGAPPSLRA
jgi:DNA/RNA endonuclease G (NUC1)